MLKQALIASSLAIASLGAFTAPAASAATSIYVQVAPPAPRYEVVPAPRRGQVWVPGHWEWNQRRYAWVGGYFVQARPGYHYAQPHWVQHGNRWGYERGGWARGDRDRDGVANRYDRDRDNDGVPNRHDRAPNNPRQR
jgi:WXXGXW repeat (2 copies)